MVQIRIFFAAAAVFGSAALAATPTTQAKPAGKSADKANRLVCKAINTTGSRIMSDRVCKTQREWDTDADAARDDFENAPRRPSGDQNSSPN